MMKTRRLLSVLFATCMLVASTLPAEAVSCTTEEAQLSEYAGSTAKCQLVKFSDSGTFQADTCEMWVSQYDVAGNS